MYPFQGSFTPLQLRWDASGISTTCPGVSKSCPSWLSSWDWPLCSSLAVLLGLSPQRCTLHMHSSVTHKRSGHPCGFLELHLCSNPFCPGLCPTNSISIPQCSKATRLYLGPVPQEKCPPPEIQGNCSTYLSCFPFLRDHSSVLPIVHCLKIVNAYILSGLQLLRAAGYVQYTYPILLT